MLLHVAKLHDVLCRHFGWSGVTFLLSRVGFFLFKTFKKRIGKFLFTFSESPQHLKIMSGAAYLSICYGL